MELFARAGVTVTPAGLCECGATINVEVGICVREHFMVCPVVDANIMQAQLLLGS